MSQERNALAKLVIRMIAAGLNDAVIARMMDTSSTLGEFGAPLTTADWVAAIRDVISQFN